MENDKETKDSNRVVELGDSTIGKIISEVKGLIMINPERHDHSEVVYKPKEKIKVKSKNNK